MSTDAVAPRVFVSHASEDKSRFAIPFTMQLLESGIDAWLDKWEMGGGDSLVQRIFEEGIAQSDAFVVVLSHVSVSKPWVREELDAGVVRRINSNGSKRLIPIVLDEGVDVPVALQHLLWLSVPNDGLEGVAAQVIDVLYGRSAKPALGSRPRYLEASTRWTSNAADETVFQLVVEFLRSHDGPGWMMFSNEIQASAANEGLSADQFHESMHALTQDHLITAQVMSGGRRWMIYPLPDRVWLEVEQDGGVNLEGVQRQLLSEIVNDGESHHTVTVVGDASWHTTGALLRQWEARKLFTVHSLGNKPAYAVSGISPLARRELRNIE